MIPATGRFAVIAVLTTLLLASLPAAGQTPREAEWDPQTVEGQAVGAGFLAGGYIAYGTTNSGPAVGPGPGPGDCGTDNEDFDLYLFTFPAGDGCIQGLDTADDETGREGVTALTTAERLGRVVVGMASSDSPGASDLSLAAWDLDEEELSQAWTKTTQGPVLALDTDTRGQRTVATVQGGPNTFHLNVYATNGARTDAFDLRGQPRDVDLSPNARYAAVGGNFTQDGTDVGWIHVYDLSASSGDNPVVEQTFERGRSGIVQSVAATNAGPAYLGTLDGTVGHLALDGTLVDHDLGDAEALVAANADGSIAVAAAGSEIARISTADGTLAPVWNHTLNGTASDVIVRAPYLLGVADEITALNPSGTALWTVPAGATVATNRTGLGLATADDDDGTTSTLTAREVHAQATINQSDPTPRISPGDIGRVNLTIQNEGAAILKASLSATQRPAADVTFTPETVTVLPGRNATVQASIEASQQARPGITKIPVELRSTPFVDAGTNLTFDVGTASSVRVRLEPGTVTEQAVTHGQQLTARFLVSNRGNTDTQVQLGLRQTVSQGDTWPVQLTPRGTITVARDSTTTVTLEITVPATAPNGTTNRIVLRGSSGGSAQAASLTYTVNPFQALSLSPATLTKTMAPGTTETYRFQLTNEGSVPANVSLDSQALTDDGAPYVPSNWGVVLDRNRLELQPGSTTELTLEITGPRNATDRSLRVQVIASTTEGARASSIAYGVVDPNLAPPDNGDANEQPLGALLPLAGLIAAAALARRSRHGNL